MTPLIESWARAFRALQPRATVQVSRDIALSADGLKALVNGQADVVAFVRVPFPAEIADFTRKFGYPPQLVNVAGGSFATKGGTHALAIFINSANPLARKIYLGLNRPPDHAFAPLVLEFISFVLSREGQEEVALTRAGFLPLNARQAATARAQWQ